MGLLERLRGEHREAGERPASLARDAARMRATLTSLHAERGGRDEPDLPSITRDLLEGEVEAPTADVRWLPTRQPILLDLWPLKGIDTVKVADKIEELAYAEHPAAIAVGFLIWARQSGKLNSFFDSIFNKLVNSVDSAPTPTP